MAEPLIVSSGPAAVETADKVHCGICRRQFSKYTCPTCNVAYCSLTCFRSESHSQCSETFYRKEVQTSINSEPSRSADEKLKMMELLKRIEQQSQEDHPNLDPDNEGMEGDDDADLTQRFADMDIGSIPSDTLWSMLTPQEREKFMKALDNPSSELAQQLLASEELHSERLEPWWETPSLDDAAETSSAKRYGAKPRAMPIPSIIPEVPRTGSPLLYNICALCIAYAYTTRYLSTSPLSSLMADNADFQEARHIISQLAPFLTNRKSRVLHSSLSGVITDVWSRFEPGKIDDKLVALLLRDTVQLLRPRVLTVISSPTRPTQETAVSAYPSRSAIDSHPCLFSILMLSDLCKLFELVGLPKQGSDVVVPRQNHVTLKITFYAAYILSTPTTILSGLSDEIVERSNVVEQEAILSPSNVVTDHQPNVPHSSSGGWITGGHNSHPEVKNVKITSKIEELT